VEKNKLYIYLAKLDKKGIEVITSFPYTTKVFPTRARDIASLNMNREVSAKVNNMVTEYKMSHELFLESAESFEKLKISLRKRGYSNLPSHQFSGTIKNTTINEKALITKNSIMLAKIKQ